VTSRAIAAALLLLALAGCGSEAVGRYPPAAEPPVSPPLAAPPAGRVVPVGRQPEGVAVDSRTGVVAVALRGPAELTLRNERGAALRQVRLAGAARHLALAGSGGPFLVPEESGARLQAVAAPTGAIVASVAVGVGPHEATAEAGRWFVGNEFGDSVSVIHGDAEVARFGVALQPGGVAADGQGRLAVVAVRQRVLELYATTRLHRLARAAAGVGPTHVACLGDYCFVVDTGGDALLIFSLDPRIDLVRRLYLPGGPYGVALDARRRRLWVTLPGINELAEVSLDGWRTRVSGMLPAVRQANTVAVDDVTGRVFVTGRHDGVLQIIGRR
jgi:DNA-binding beta-propeller fold protein YncE